MTWQRLSLGFVWFVASCTLGGSDEDPTNGIVPEDASAPLDAATLDARVELDASTTPRDASPADSAQAPVDAVVEQVCEPSPAPAVCDPVKNTECPPLMQCEIDPEATMPSGRCVFWMLQILDQCSSDGLNTTCEGPSSCVDGTCRKPCYCDADCDMGACCKGAAPGPAGPIKLCEPC
ncbi:MAG: hypothetical protein ABW352_12910 [Polyangiales bacterium]